MPFFPIITALIRAIKTWCGQIGSKHFKQIAEYCFGGPRIKGRPLQLVAQSEDQDCTAIDLILTAEKIYTSTDIAPTVEAVGIARTRSQSLAPGKQSAPAPVVATGS